ncbi:MAG: substrate-binding domain-containing protein [Pseudomonadota bacterium]
MRIAVLILMMLGSAACDAPVNLSKIPEQTDAPPVYDIGAAEKIKIIGSSTVAPFSTTVAEQFGAITPHPAPVVETTGTGGGFKAFCRAIGPQEPSIVNASRKIKPSERALCTAAGIADPLEIKIGYDGIVLANGKAGPDLNLTKAQIYQALAAELPDGKGAWIENPYARWNEISVDLPDMRILVSGPPPTSGTRDAFVEIAMEAGALAFPEMIALQAQDLQAFQARAREIRNDGAWIDSGENDSSIINALLRNEDAVGVLGYSFLEQNADRVKGADIGGFAPTFENITSGAYGISRSMYFYVKHENVALVPGLADFVSEFTEEDAWGMEGYLIEKGLIPLEQDERRRIRTEALTALTMPKNQLPSEHAPSPQQTAPDLPD